MAYSANKDPNAVLDYQFNWASWLGSDTIQTSTWDVPDGITKTGEDNSDTTATIWLSGGTAGTSYTLVNQIVTAGGRTDERTLVIHVKDK
jgi:hypothetical protein